jgi:hypothetical protein
MCEDLRRVQGAAQAPGLHDVFSPSLSAVRLSESRPHKQHQLDFRRSPQIHGVLSSLPRCSKVKSRLSSSAQSAEDALVAPLQGDSVLVRLHRNV